MNLKSLIGTTTQKSEGVFLGSSEAEAEAASNARIQLIDVYQDFHDLAGALEHEKFIISGRKGTGKSAFAEYVRLKSQGNANLFCQFVRSSDVALEQQAQVNKAGDSVAAEESIFAWLIYTNILKLFAFSEAAREHKEYDTLRKFIDRNSGFINVQDYEVVESVKEHGFSVNVEYLRRFLSTRGGFKSSIRAAKAPYYKLLPDLERIVVSILGSGLDKKNNNHYLVFFDDLDTRFSATDQASVHSLLQLVRTARHINLEVFAKNNISAKAVLLLRDDIEAHLSSNYPDTAKIFSSYAARINWYQDIYSRVVDEDEINLKRFIVTRIEKAFDRARIPIRGDAWNALVSEKSDDKSTFKYVLNNTLFRPRDLLLFFSPLQSGDFSLPLDRRQLFSLIQAYSEELAKETKNELSSFYSPHYIELIFQALGLVYENKNCDYVAAIRHIEDCCGAGNAESLLNMLFERSIIGNVNSNGWYTFRCREPVSAADYTTIDRNQNIVIQYGIGNYLKRKGYS